MCKVYVLIYKIETAQHLSVWYIDLLKRFKYIIGFSLDIFNCCLFDCFTSKLMTSRRSI